MTPAPLASYGIDNRLSASLALLKRSEIFLCDEVLHGCRCLYPMSWLFTSLKSPQDVVVPVMAAFERT